MARKVGYQSKAFSYRLESHFKEAKNHARNELASSISYATGKGLETAQSRLAGVEGSDPIHIADNLYNGTSINGLTGWVATDVDYARFVEYGTVRTAPLPFIRPAYRTMRKAFLERLGAGILKDFATSRVRTHARSKRGLLTARRQGRIGKRELNRRLGEL